MGCILAGQTGVFLLLGVAAFLRMNQRRAFAAGLLLTLCTFKPHLFLLLWPVLLLHCFYRRQFKILIGIAAGILSAIVFALNSDAHVLTDYLAAAHGEHIEVAVHFPEHLLHSSCADPFPSPMASTRSYSHRRHLGYLVLEPSS